MAVAMPTAAAADSPTLMSMGTTGTCKLSMLLNWNTIDACFLFPSFQIHSSFAFSATCFGAFLLVIALEFLRRLQRQFDTYLRARNACMREGGYAVAEEMEEKLLGKEEGEKGDGRPRVRVRVAVVLEQGARGVVHMLQFAVSYCIMLLFMYSNGYIVISILLGALVGFALCTRDTLHLRTDIVMGERDKTCC